MSIEKIRFELLETPQERHQAKLFAHQISHSWYRCVPSEMPDYILAAKEGEKILSTVGMTAYQKILPIQNLYDIDHRDFPQNFLWQDSMQFNWFFSNKKGIFPLLLLKALHFSYQQQIKYGILQMKDNVFSILSQKGLQLEKVPSAKLLLKEIPLAARSYYLEKTQINVYYFNIQENMNSLQKYIQCHFSEQAETPVFLKENQYVVCKSEEYQASL